MKARFTIILSVVFVSIAFTGDRRTRTELEHIDSLTEGNQSAAIAYIDNLTAVSGNGMSRGSRMRLEMLKAKARNKIYLPHNQDSLFMLDKYFDAKGTANERMLTKYIIGCSCVRKIRNERCKLS